MANQLRISQPPLDLTLAMQQLTRREKAEGNQPPRRHDFLAASMAIEALTIESPCETHSQLGIQRSYWEVRNVLGEGRRSRH